MGEDNIVCNEDEVVKIVRNTMLPDMADIKTAIELMSKDIQHLLEDRNKEHAKIASDISDLKTEVTKIKVAIFGNGDGEIEGLKPKVTSIEKWIKTRSRLEWIIVTAIITQTVALLIVVTQHILSTQ